MVQVVVLSANGEKKSADLPTVTGPMVAKLYRKAKAATLLGTYSQGISIWGWKEGKAGTENKHELPPPHDTELFFGDVIATIQEGDLAIEDWDSFYNEVLAFEDLDEEEAEAEIEAEVEEVEEEEEDEEEEEEAEGEAEEDEVEEEVDDDCYDDGDEAGGGSRRRAPRKKTSQTVEYRRIDMGLKARIKLPAPLGKRAPKWLTEPELEEETYT